MASVVALSTSVWCISRSVFVWLICCDARLLIRIRCLSRLGWVLLSFISLLLWNIELLLNLVYISVCFVQLNVSAIPTTMWITFILILCRSLAHLWLLHFNLFLNLLNLTDLLLLFGFHQSIRFLWLISHGRLAVLLVLACIKFQWHSRCWWCWLEIMVLRHVSHLLRKLLGMDLWRYQFCLALRSFSLHLLIWENDMWLFIRWLIVLIYRHLIWNLHRISWKVVLTHLHLWWIRIIWNSFVHTWDIGFLLWRNLVCSKYAKLWFCLNIWDLLLVILVLKIRTIVILEVLINRWTH